MNPIPEHGVPSTAAIGRHPIHPMLIPFPVAFLVGALLTDVAFWATADPFWARVSFWLLVAGLVTGALAAVFGMIDFWTIPRAREHTAGWVHLVGNALALALTFVNVLLRAGDAQAAVMPWGITLSAAVAVLLGVTGWYGGELAYRYKIGVMEPEGGAQYD